MQALSASLVSALGQASQGLPEVQEPLLEPRTEEEVKSIRLTIDAEVNDEMTDDQVLESIEMYLNQMDYGLFKAELLEWHYTKNA